MTDTLTHFIAGERVAADTPNSSVNPSNTDDIVARFPAGGKDEVDAAAKAARAAFPGWADASPEVRSDLLDKVGATIMARAPELGRLLAREEGKTLAEGTGEVMRAARIFKYFAGEALRRHGYTLPSTRPGLDVETHREPLGVCRADHALELPDRDSGLEVGAGAGLRQHRGAQARRPDAGHRLGAGRHHPRGGRAAGRVQPRARRKRRRRGDRRPSRASTSSRSPAPNMSAARSPRRRSGARRGCSSRWAARIRWSSSTTPISSAPSPARSTAPSTAPASAARRRRG